MQRAALVGVITLKARDATCQANETHMEGFAELNPINKNFPFTKIPPRLYTILPLKQVKNVTIVH